MPTRLTRFLGVVLITAVAGCTSVSRGIGGITANKFAEPRSGTVWVTPPPQLEPPRAQNRTIYISFRNISDAADLNLLPTLRSAAEEQGWVLVNDPQSAKYRLRTTMRYFGEVKPESGGQSIAAGLGGITGAAIGASSGLLIARGANAPIGGAIAGGTVGGIAGGLMAAGLANASRPREWAFIIDAVLEEYSDQPVEFELATSSGQTQLDGAGTGNSRFASGGTGANSNTRQATIKQTSNYFPHGVRLSAWANQMNMKQEEALPLLMERTRIVMTQILPQ